MTIRRLQPSELKVFQHDVVEKVVTSTYYDADIVLTTFSYFYDALEDNSPVWYFTKEQALQWGLRCLLAAYEEDADPTVVAAGMLYQIKQGRHQRDPAEKGISLYGIDARKDWTSQFVRPEQDDAVRHQRKSPSSRAKPAKVRKGPKAVEARIQ